MIRVISAVALVATLLLAACQSTPPPAADTGGTTVGNVTVRTGGYVRVDSGVVN